jgi:glycerol kinase
MATGIWEDAEAFLGASDEPARFKPSLDEEERARLVRGWRRAIAATLAWADHDDDA